MTPVNVGRAVAVGTAVIGISMAQMILTGVCLAVGFQLGGILVSKISDAVADKKLREGEEESPEPAGDVIVNA